MSDPWGFCSEGTDLGRRPLDVASGGGLLLVLSLSHLVAPLSPNQLGSRT